MSFVPSELVDEATGAPRRDALSLDDFAILGLPRTMNLTAADVRDAFFRRAPFVHPDRYAAREPAVRALADALHARMSDAQTKLADDYGRAEKLLAIWGGTAPAADRRTPPAFLMAVMELQERLQGTGEQRETAKAKIDRLAETLTGSLKELLAGPGPTAEQLSRAREELDKLSYLRKIRRDFGLRTPGSGGGGE